jgi:stalled ribosome rescue protein Dom34
MTKEVGLWIDHRQAVIVSYLDEQEQNIQRVASDVEKRVRYSGDTSESQGSTEDGRDRQFDNQLNHFYDEVISYLRDATSILILGPGEAKGELQKRLENQGVSEEIITLKTTDKLTDNQVAAEVRQHFQ